ncbi:immunoglobulin superfamily member 10 [Sardina pilchardus]|uniref:immunoglobulin superfamily member 10 n=1 Tax=Sardina pilchardus TaxID=27697 RepID=UPI002E1155E5
MDFPGDRVQLSLLLLLAQLSLVLSRPGEACPRPCSCQQPGEVHCTFRSLMAVPAGIPKQVERMNLGFNSISRITDSSLAGLRKLDLLMMHGNDIHNIPDGAFRDLSSLQMLKLSYNKLREVGRGTLWGLWSLTRLHLDHNRLESLHPDAFQGLTGLRLLQLEGNRLQQLHPHALCTFSLLGHFPFSTLRHLHLADNSLRRIPPELLRGAPLLETLTLHGNPWSCDCGMRWFRAWNQRAAGVLKCKKDRAYEGGQLCPLCSSPASLRQKELQQLDDLTCSAPVISSAQRTSVPEDTDSEVTPPEEFRPALGNISLGLTDEHGNKVNLECSVREMDGSTRVSWAQLGAGSTSISANVSFSVDLECPMDRGNYERLWRLIAYYSDVPAHLQREVMLEKEPNLSYRYRQDPERDALYFTGVRASVQARPSWVMQPEMDLQLNRRQSTGKLVRLLLSARTTQHLEPKEARDQNRAWVLIQNHNRTRTAVTTVVGQSVALDCSVTSSGDAATLEWVLPDGSRVSAPHRGSDGRLSVADSGQLSLRATEHGDAGLYYCVAHVAGDFSVLPFRLVVEESSSPPPGGEGVTAPVSGFATERVSLPCEASGSPDAERHWILPDGHVLSPHSNAAARAILAANGSLVLPHGQISDNGYYKCVALSAHGVDTLATKLTLSRRQGRPLQRPPVRPQGAKGVSTRVRPKPPQARTEKREEEQEEEEEEVEGASGEEGIQEEVVEQSEKRGGEASFPRRRMMQGGGRGGGGGGGHPSRNSWRRPGMQRKPIRPGNHGAERGSVEPSLQPRRRVGLSNNQIDPERWANILAKVRDRTRGTTPSPSRTTTEPALTDEATTNSPLDYPEEDQFEETTTPEPVTESPMGLSTLYTEVQTTEQTTEPPLDLDDPEEENPEFTTEPPLDLDDPEEENPNFTTEPPLDLDDPEEEISDSTTEPPLDIRSLYEEEQKHVIYQISEPDTDLFTEGTDSPLDMNTPPTDAAEDLLSVEGDSFEADVTTAPELVRSHAQPITPASSSSSSSSSSSRLAGPTVASKPRIETSGRAKSAVASPDSAVPLPEGQTPGTTPAPPITRAPPTRLVPAPKIPPSGGTAARPQSPGAAQPSPAVPTTARGRPRISSASVSTVTVAAEADAHLPCVSSGEPRPFLSWTKVSTGASVAQNTRIQRFEVHSNGTFIIRKTLPSDRGQYMCSVQNQYGEDRAVVSLVVLSEHPRIVNPKYREASVHMGDSVDLECQAKGHPTPRVTWVLPDRGMVHTGALASTGSSVQRVALFPNGTLRITQSVYADRGIYKCIASNAAGADSVTVRLQVSALPPTILQGRHDNVSLPEGSTAYLHCSAQGSPSPAVRWTTPDNTQLRPSQFVTGRNLFVFPNGTLFVRSLGLADSGRYECAATNTIGAAWRAISLAVVPATASLRARIISSSPQNTQVGYGAQLRLDCIAAGKPEPRIIWRTPSKKLVDAQYSYDPRLNVFPNGTLVLQPMTEKDEGDYLCVARNKMGDDYVLLRVAVVTKPAKIMQKSSLSQEVTYGSDLRVDCVALGLPNPKIQWALPDGTMINSIMTFNPSASGPSRSRRYVVFDNGTLFFNDVGMREEGDYTCYADNQVGKDEMKVRVKVVSDAPVIRNQTQLPVRVLYGESASLRCEAKGEPTPTVLWFSPASRTIPTSSDKYRIHSDGTLVIQKVQRLDGGNYTCLARNSAGQARQVTRLEILVSPPTINGQRGVANSARERGVTDQRKLLDCVATGMPVPRIMWVLPNNVILPAPYYGSRMTVHRNGTLEIRGLKRGDAAQLTCVAQNEGGEARMQVLLEVQDPEERPPPPPPPQQRPPLLPSPPLHRPALPSPPHQRPALPSPPLHRPAPPLTPMHRPAPPLTPVHRPAPPSTSLQIPKTDTRPLTIGAPILLNCSLAGSPLVPLTWVLPNGSPLASGARFSRFYHRPDGALLISNPTLSESGVYRCMGRSGVTGSLVERSVALVPERPPEISSRYTAPISILIGANLQLHCQAREGAAPVRLSWKLPTGVVLTQSQRAGRYNVLPNGTLSITQASAHDRGSYVCHVANEYGSASLTVPVIVITYAPRITSGPALTTQARRGVAVQLNCGATGLPRPEIAWETPDRTRLVVSPQPRLFGNKYLHPQGALIIQNPSPSDSGFYRCTARSVIGVDSKGTYLRVL